jgi:hypothetical protein
MTFDQEKNKNSSFKIALVEVDLPRSGGDLINYEAGIWFRRLAELVPRTGNFSLYQAYATDNPDKTLFRVGSLRVGFTPYIKTETLQDCRDTEESFYYENDTTLLYVHFKYSDKPGIHGPVTLGIINGFADSADADNLSFYQDINYEPLLTGIPSLRNSKDAIFFGKIQFQGGAIKFNNASGEFDDWRNLNIYGQSVRILQGFSGLPYSEFVQVFEAFVEDFSWDRKGFRLNVKDLRKGLQTPLPPNLYTTDVFPDLQEDDEGKPVPLAWGPVIRGKCTFIEEVTALTKFKFNFMDTSYYSATSLDAVYVDEVEVTPESTDLDNATFILDAAVWLGEGTVTASFTGANVTDISDIVVDLLDKYGQLPFNDTIYNTTEWTAESANTKKGFLYYGDMGTIIDGLEKMSVSDSAQYIVQGDGKLTQRIFDITRTPVKTIHDIEWITPPKFSQSNKEYLSSVRIKYNKNHETGRFQTYTNKDFEDEVFGRYQKLRQKDIETNLTTEAGAISVSNDIMERAKQITDTIKRRTIVKNVDLKLMDFIIANHERIGKPEILKTYEIISIDPKPVGNGEIDLIMREVPGV